MTRSVCALVLGLCLVLPAAAQHRVVVQEAQIGRAHSFQVSPDGKLAWVVAGVGEHVLQVLDPVGPVVLRQYYLPERIEFASVDRASGKVAVSTRSSIFLGSLTDDALEEILHGIYGAVLLQDEAQVLAVLGFIPDPKKKETPRPWFREERSLGIYDLAKKEWRFIQRTPIVAPYLDTRSHDGWPALLFSDGAILAGGIGGTLGSMIPVTFSADARMDLKTGKTRITTGPSSRFGKIIEEKPLLKDKGLPGEKDPREVVPEGYEGVELKHEAKYAPPPALVKAHERALATIKKLQGEEILEKLRLGETHVRDAQPMPFAIGADRVQIAVRRYLRSVGGFGSHSAVLTLDKKGNLDLGPTQNTTDNPFGRGLLSYFHTERSEVDLRDLITGKRLVPQDALDVKGAKEFYFLDEGTLVHDTERMTFFSRGAVKPLWSRKKSVDRWADVVVDGERKSLALVFGGQPILAQVLRLEDGELLGNVPRPAGVDDNYMDMDLSHDGKRLGVMFRREMLVFEVASGKLLEKHLAPEDSYGRGLESWSGGWLVTGESGSQLFDDATKKWTAKIAITSVVNLQEIETPKGKRLVLQNYNGQCCLADPADGKVLSRWMASEYGQHRVPRWNAVFAGGKAMLRPTGWIPTLELVDLRDARLVLTIHSVPIEKSLGFIAFTPDGWWDATPGAERHVAVFEKGVRVGDEARDARRNAKVIEERVAGVWK